LWIDFSIADNYDKKKGGNKKVVCQYDNSYTPASNEVCGVAGVHKRHLQSIEKNAWPTFGIISIERMGVLPTNLE
jgi:hypothetical protein